MPRLVGFLTLTMPFFTSCDSQIPSILLLHLIHGEGSNAAWTEKHPSRYMPAVIANLSCPPLLPVACCGPFSLFDAFCRRRRHQVICSAGTDEKKAAAVFDGADQGGRLESSIVVERISCLGRIRNADGISGQACSVSIPQSGLRLSRHPSSCT